MSGEAKAETPRGMTPKRRKLLAAMASGCSPMRASYWGEIAFGASPYRQPQHYARPATVALRWLESQGLVRFHHRENEWSATPAGVAAAKGMRDA